MKITEENKLWIDTRLTEEEMNFLWQNISEGVPCHPAGNISKSERLKDKDNWFYENVLKKLTERMFYHDWDNYYKYHIAVEEGEPLPKFEMNSFWVNRQKQHEFNPIHGHMGDALSLFSFVIFMKIPFHWEEQHAIPMVNSYPSCASDFMFVRSEKGSEICSPISFSFSPKDEGRMLFFPATLQHMVYPFYKCEEERVTIAGNIALYDSNRPKEQEVINMSVYEEKEKMLKMMEESVRVTREELKNLKKEA